MAARLQGAHLHVPGRAVAVPGLVAKLYDLHRAVVGGAKVGAKLVAQLRGGRGEGRSEGRNILARLPGENASPPTEQARKGVFSFKQAAVSGAGRVYGRTL